MDLSAADYGKVAFAKAYWVLNKKEWTFMKSLSELRNKFVHDIKKVGLTVSDYLGSVDTNQRKKYSKAFSSLPRPDGSNPQGWEGAFEKGPRFFTWIGTRAVLTSAFLAKQHAGLKHQMNAMARARLLLPDNLDSLGPKSSGN